jgi:hypothetical protein
MYIHTDHVNAIPTSSLVDRMMVTALACDGSCGIRMFPPDLPSTIPFNKYGLELGENKNPMIPTHARST